MDEYTFANILFFFFVVSAQMRKPHQMWWPPIRIKSKSINQNQIKRLYSGCLARHSDPFNFQLMLSISRSLPPSWWTHSSVIGPKLNLKDTRVDLEISLISHEIKPLFEHIESRMAFTFQMRKEHQQFQLPLERVHTAYEFVHWS